MNEDFIELINSEYKKLQNGEPCFYIGEGNPDAKILIIGNECAIADDNPRVQGKIPDKCSEEKRREYKERIIAEDNVLQWHIRLGQKDIEENIQCELHEPNPNNTPHNRYYPFFPWLGQKCTIRATDKEGNVIRGEKGTARTWVQYQKLTDCIYNREFNRNNLVDFHLYAFHTELSQIPLCSSSLADEQTGKNIRLRLDKLFRHTFFKKFPVVIIAAGHYLRDYVFKSTKYNIEEVFNIEEIFNVKYDGIYKLGNKNNEWINLHHGNDSNSPQLLIHTRHIAGSISNEYIEEIAKRIRNVVIK